MSNDPTKIASSGLLRSSHLARAVARVYSVLGCGQRWRVGSMLIDIILRLEGGAAYSETARRVMLAHHGVRIGAYTYGPCFQPGAFPPEVEIGRYTSIATTARVFNENHPTSGCSTHPFFYPSSARQRIRIGSDVWIGHNAVILPGCHVVGDGAIIGAGAIVTHDVPPFAIVAGSPAKVLRFRFSQEVRERVMKSLWWEKDIGGASAIAKEIL
jgi:virginiamycin A acetyltransferase